MSYRKIGPKHCDYPRLQACRKKGLWMCDAVTHNSPGGCMNPQCFKYRFAPDGTLENAYNEAGMPTLGKAVSATLERMGIGNIQIGKKVLKV